MTRPSAAAPGAARLSAGFAAIYLCWGATFLAIRYLVAEVPPLLGFALRCGAGALCFYAWLAATGRTLTAGRSEWGNAFASGVLLFLGCHGILAWAEQRVSSGEAALLLTSIPLWMTVLDARRRRSWPRPQVLLALLLGIIGIAILTASGSPGRAATAWERVALIGSGLCWALGTLVSRQGPRPRSVALTTAMQLTAGAAVLLLASLATGEVLRWSPAEVSIRAWGALGFLIIGGTVIGFGAYNWLLGVVTPAAVGTYAFVNPLVALALAWILGDGAPGPRTLLAAVLVTAAVSLIWRDSSRASGAHSPRGGAELEARRENGDGNPSAGGIVTRSVA